MQELKRVPIKKIEEATTPLQVVYGRFDERHPDSRVVRMSYAVRNSAVHELQLDTDDGAAHVLSTTWDGACYTHSTLDRLGKVTFESLEI